MCLKKNIEKQKTNIEEQRINIEKQENKYWK